MFKVEQAEYEAEGVAWESVEFADNAETVALIDQKVGVFALLNEECRLPKGTDAGLVEKLEHRFKDHAAFAMPKRGRGAPDAACFTINHFAYPVTYGADGFLEKNRDRLFDDIEAALTTSKNAFVRELFGGEAGDGADAPPDRTRAAATLSRSTPSAARGGGAAGLRGGRGGPAGAGRGGRGGGGAGRGRGGGPPSGGNRPNGPPRTGRERALTMSALGGVKKPRNTAAPAKKQTTLSTRFKVQLTDLYKTIDETMPHYIRCLKVRSRRTARLALRLRLSHSAQPNEDQAPNNLVPDYVGRQLHYCGLMETVRIRKAGYALRMPYKAFVEHYRVLLPGVKNIGPMEYKVRCAPFSSDCTRDF